MSRRRGGKSSRSRGGRGQSSGTKRIKGYCLPVTLSLTNSSGLPVITSLDIDTNFCTVWSTLATVFQRWKLHSLVITITPINGSTTRGTLSSCVQEDDPSVAPASTAEVMSQRRAVIGSNVNAVTYSYVPVHNIWFYCGDNITSDDRWEMPGRLHVLSSDYTSAIIPAVVTCHYDVSFDTVTTPNTASIERLLAVYAHESPEPTGELHGQTTQSTGNFTAVPAREVCSNSLSPVEPLAGTSWADVVESEYPITRAQPTRFGTGRVVPRMASRGSVMRSGASSQMRRPLRGQPP